MKKYIREISPKPFFITVLIAFLLLPTASCISSAEGDLVDSILANVDTVDGEAVFHTKDGRTITITVTGESQEGTVTKEEKPTQTCYEKDDKQVNETKEKLADILPKVDSIENIFQTLGVWEQAHELSNKGLTWAHIAVELGFSNETMYRELQEDIELRIRHAKELGLINQEQYEYKIKHYSETALKYVNKIFADGIEPTEVDSASLLASISSIEDVFQALGLWEKASQLHQNGLSWGEVATELDLTEEIMYRELKDDIEERLHQAKSKGLISYEQYKEKFENYCTEALEWVHMIFAE
jgi:orotate phosphoribosyltransferase-like protein